ncbi:pentalenene synthase [Colletotrichum sp. SAR 10_65]|nr:pentalenene synthase [Colletotrichum sp. SAR 10_65]
MTDKNPNSAHHLLFNTDTKPIEGEDLSVIGILCSQGYTLQEAMDEAGRMIDTRYRRWYEALAQMPSWGSKQDRVVLKYLGGLRDIALGSLLWR